MAKSQYLSVAHVESYNLLQASAYSLQRRGSFNDLSKLSSDSSDEVADDRKKCKSAEVIKTEPPTTIIVVPEIEIEIREDESWICEVEKTETIEVNEERVEIVEEDALSHDEDEKMFLEYQRCAIASRRRRSFNERRERDCTSETESTNSSRPSSYAQPDSGQSSRRGSMYLALPGTPTSLTESASNPSSPRASPRSSVCIGNEEEGRTAVVSPGTGWNRLKRMFKENKLKEGAPNHLNKPAVSYSILRRSSCDSPLQTPRPYKMPLCESVVSPSYTLDDLNEEDVPPVITKADGWARLKKKFKEGKLKPMLEEDISNGRYTKVDTNNNSTSIGSKKARKTKSELNGKNALHNAIIEGDLNAVKRIIDSGKIDINFLKQPGLTPLHVACAFGNLKIIEILVSNGADVKIKTYTRITPLQIATLFGHFEVCQFLISKGANGLDVQDGFVHDLKLMSSVLMK